MSVEGDLFLAGNDIDIRGVINGDVRVAGENITLNGSVFGDVLAAGSTLAFTEDSVIGKGLAVAGSKIDLDGAIGGTSYVGGAQMNVHGTFAQDLNAYGEGLKFFDGASVGKNLIYSTPDTLGNVDSFVEGTVTYKEPQSADFSSVVLIGLLWKVVVLGLLVSLLTYLVTLFMPGLGKRSLGYLKERSLATFGYGLLAFILTPIVALILLLVVWVSPVALIVFALYAVLIFFSQLIAVLTLREWFFTDQHQVLSFMIPSFIVAILVTLPIVSGIVNMVIVLFGLGVVVLSVFGRASAVSKASSKQVEQAE